MQAEAGKGSSPRKQQDRVSYRDNYDRIFGKKERPRYSKEDIEREAQQNAMRELVELSEELGLYK